VQDIPPDQLLRRVFETCTNFSEAQRMLETTPIARPVIYTLVGCKPGERCVIERTEQSARTRSVETATATDWLESMPGWEERIGGRRLLACTFEDAAQNSRGRREALAGWPGNFSQAQFDWITPPVLNACPRIAGEMCPATGVLRTIGYEL